MYFSEELIDEIQQKNDIVDVISQYIHLQKKGSNYVAVCPFHNDKNPSFSVSQPKQLYKCFACGEAGSVFTFLQKYENYTFPEAVKILAERAGVKLPEENNSAANRAKESRRVRFLEVNKEAAKYYYYLLRSDKGKVGMDYLKRRELTEETRNKFGLGYSSTYGSDLLSYLKSKGYTDEEIIGAGLASHSEKYGLSSKFWNRVMFPIQDSNHRVIGFGGRVMGDGEPKYLNSPETEIFDKSRNLYGLNFARTSRKDNIILCEGRNMSAIAKSLGITVGSLTTSMNSLVKKAYVERERSEEDRRVVMIRLTEKGMRAYEQHKNFHDEMTEAVIASIDKDEIPTLANVLQGLIKFFREYNK